MNKIGILLAGIVTCVLAITYIPQFIIYLFGCYQIGSWVGKIAEKIINKEDERG